MNNIQQTLVCPRCGTAIQITGEVKELPQSDIETTEDILKLFSLSVRKQMKIQINGNHAIIELTGKIGKKQFSSVVQEVSGYGGRYIKGYFSMPMPEVSK